MMGQPYTGIGMLGYANHAKKYVSTWMDSMGTGIFSMEGKADKHDTRITLQGRYDDPLQGAMNLRAVMKLLDADHEMEITYRRKH